MDTILDQIIPRLSPIAYCVIFKRGTVQDRALTTGFIQLVEKDNHHVLQQIFNGYNFHPDEYQEQSHRNILETEVKDDFNFQFIDDDYTPRPIKCDECRNFHLYINHIIDNFKPTSTSTPPSTSMHTQIPTTIITFHPVKRTLSMEDLTISKRIKHEVTSPNKHTPPTPNTQQHNKEQPSDDEYEDVQFIKKQTTNKQHISLASIITPTPTTSTTTTFIYA